VYKYESGGDPEAIPQLTYEEFNDYHKNYYHPVNSYIYLYGDVDVKERLDYLDREYLSDFDANDVQIDSDIALQMPFEKMADETHYYAVTDDEPVENNSYISYNKVIGESTDAKLYLAVQIMDYALIMAPGARLKQALIDKGITTDVYSNFETSVRQPVYSIVARNCDESKKQLFIDTINETIEHILEDGINMRMIDAAINYYEFKYREADYGSYPKGLMSYLTMMDSWLYDDSKPFIHLEELDIFEQIKQEKDKGLFEGIARKYILDNNHGSVITLVPKRGLAEENAAKTAKKLADYKASLTDEQIEEIVKSTRELKEYQDEPSSQKDLESIPTLKLEDIEKSAEKLYNDPKKVGGVTVVHHNMFTSGIAYITLSFNCHKVPEELIPYLGLLPMTLGLMDTDNFTYPELSSEININCGGINTGGSIYCDDKDYDKYSICYEIKGKSLYDKIPVMLDMMYEMMYRTHFDDYKRLKDIISRAKSRLESSMISSGHVVACSYGTAQFSTTGYYSDKISGYENYVFIKNLEKHYDEMKETIAENLSKCTKYIFSKDNLIVSATIDEEGFDKNLKKSMADFTDKLSVSDAPVVKREFVPRKVKTGFTSSSQVQYVARCGNFIDKGYHYTGALRVLRTIFSYEYLWVNVRVKGGAYGCMSGFNRNGDIYMVSYRDPNLRKTDEIFQNAGDFVAKFDASDRDMLKYIIGTIGILDVPKNPAAKGTRSFSAYMCNTTFELYQKTRDEILSADVEAIRELAPLIRDTMSENYLCVVGNQSTIEQENDLFDAVEPLFK
jgi:Zn-dependent M16 (insulinase) family peptidase